MEKALSLAHDLTQEVLNSSYYLNYHRAYETLRKNPELWNRVTDFKKLHIEFQTKKIQNLDISFEEEKYISKLYSDLLLNERIRGFIEDEKNYLEYINKIFSIVGEIGIDKVYKVIKM